MYSKAVYDYFNSNQTTFKFQPNKLSRTNAFKRKSTTKKTIVVSKKSNTSSRILRSSVLIKNTHPKLTQNTENKSAVNVVYDTVQSIWKYAKSFISNQNSDTSRSHERLRKRIIHKTSNRRSHSKCFQSISSNIFPREKFYDMGEFSKENIQPTNVTNDEKFNSESLPEEIQTSIMKETIDKDIGNVESSIIFAEFKIQSITEINFENDLKKQSIPQEIDLNNEKLTSTTNEKTETIEESTPLEKMKQNKEITEIFVKPDLQTNETDSENLNVVEVILKSSLKTYGRGKRKNKKLHVHFKEEYDIEKPKLSTHKSQNLRKSDCCHPNALYRKLNKAEKKKSNHSIRGKKRRLALCTKSSRSSFRKKRSKRSSSSNISIQSKSSDTRDNKTCKKIRKTLKKYSTKIYKKKPAKKFKKATGNVKASETLQHIQNIAATATESEHPIRTSHDIQEEIKPIIYDDVLYNSQISNIHLQQEITTTEVDDLLEKNKAIIESNTLLEELNEFAQFLNGEQLDVTTFDNISNIDVNK